jgi:hypothetical protein
MNIIEIILFIINVVTTFQILAKSWKGWALKILVDFYYLNFFITHPSDSSTFFLVNGIVFLISHIYGVWKWYKEEQELKLIKLAEKMARENGEF